MSAWKLVPVENETHGISDAYVRGYVWAMDNWPATLTEAKKAAADYEDKWINGVIPNTTQQSELASPYPTTDEALVERVAEAIYGGDWNSLPEEAWLPNHGSIQDGKAQYRFMALAAIRAMENKS